VSVVTEPGRVQSDHVWNLVNSLAELGLRYAVLSPGYRDAPLVRAFEAHPAISTDVVVDERTAGFVALGYARASSAAAAVVCSSGSAPAHYLPAVVEAARLGLPLWVLSADRPEELQRVGAAQTVPQRDLFAEHVVWRDQLGALASLDADVPAGANWVGTRLARAWAASHAPGGGPVHINIPLRKPLSLGDRPEPRPVVQIHRGPPTLAPEAHVRLRQVADAAERVLLISGPELGLSDRGDPTLLNLSRARSWPLIADPLSRWRGAENVVQAGDRIASAAADSLRPDLVIWTGGLPTSRALQDLIAGGRCPVVQVSPSGRLTDPSHAVTDLVVAPVAEVVRSLLPSSSCPATPWWDLWQRAEAAAWDEAMAPEGPFAWDGEVWARAVAGWPGRRFHVGSSLPVRDFDAAVRLDPEDRAWGNRGANGIDGGIATAWGEATAAGEPVFLAIGDVALAHDFGSLAQLPRHVPVVVLVLNNGGGRIFAELPLREVANFERLFVTPPAADIQALAAAAGLSAERVETGRELDAALERVWHQGGRGLVEVVLDGEAARQARRNARERAGARIRAAVAGMVS
jgi:2-succinyl-5-enolpyruvyl-6-hydroxy-3-cyclohexene-1-carboxylate synthase